MEAVKVREHRAPKGALRLGPLSHPVYYIYVRKHRAPKGALRPTLVAVSAVVVETGQKAPSAKRCIKTHSNERACIAPCLSVRKHRAPKGALRQEQLSVLDADVRWQKAPSAIRCIKTRRTRASCTGSRSVIKRQAPLGALSPHALMLSMS